MTNTGKKFKKKSLWSIVHIRHHLSCNVLHTERLSLSIRPTIYLSIYLFIYCIYLSIYRSYTYVTVQVHNCTRTQAPERPPPSARQLKKLERRSLQASSNVRLDCLQKNPPILFFFCLSFFKIFTIKLRSFPAVINMKSKSKFKYSQYILV